MAVPALAGRPAPAPRAPGHRSPASRRRAAERRATAREAAARKPSAGRVRPRRSPSSGARVHAARGAIRVAQPAVAGAALLPHAAVRTVGAVRDLSDSSLIVRLTRGRAWIAVLCVLLAGIVALNVFILSLNASAGQVAERVDRLERDNSALRAELAERRSSGRVEAAAARLGMAVPDPKQVTYLRSKRGDAARAAEALGISG